MVEHQAQMLLLELERLKVLKYYCMMRRQPNWLKNKIWDLDLAVGPASPTALCIHMYPYVPILIRLDPSRPSGCVRTHLEGFGDFPILTEKTENPTVKTGKRKCRVDVRQGITPTVPIIQEPERELDISVDGTEHDGYMYSYYIWTWISMMNSYVIDIESQYPWCAVLRMRLVFARSLSSWGPRTHNENTN